MSKNKSIKTAKYITRSIGKVTGGKFIIAGSIFIIAMFLIVSIIIMGVVSAGGGFLVLYRKDSLKNGFNKIDSSNEVAENKRPPGVMELLPGSRFYYPSKMGTFTSPFGKRNVKGGSRNHMGIDIGGIHGNTVEIYPARPGKVIHAKPYPSNKLPASIKLKGTNGSKPANGQWVAVEHEVEGVKVQTYYLHMFRVLVEEGQIVNMDTPLGIVGNTGSSTGPHIHFEIRIGGVQVDPMKYMYCGGRTPKKNENISDCYSFRGEQK